MGPEISRNLSFDFPGTAKSLNRTSLLKIRETVLHLMYAYICIHTYKIENVSVLCFLCIATVLSGSAQRLACGILIAYIWSREGGLALASAARACGLPLHALGIRNYWVADTMDR